MYEIGGEQYKRVPAEYDPAQKHADLLRYAGLYVFSPRIPEKDVLTPSLVDMCFTHFQRMSPLYRWLV